eukprot:1464591-Ditylum_brightwellii.AAC.1
MGNKIPHFTIFLQSKRWGQPPLQIKAVVVSIQCAVEDVAYLKILLLEVYNKEHIKMGTYVPQGLFRMVGEEVYKHHLCVHNKYVVSITAVTIVGMHKDAMWVEIKINKEVMLLEHYLNRVHPNIESVHEIKKIESDGRWLLICKKVNMPKVIRFLDCILPNIFKEYIAGVDRMEGYDSLLRPVSSGNKTVGLYTEALKTAHNNNTSYLQQTYSQ